MGVYFFASYLCSLTEGQLEWKVSQYLAPHMRAGSDQGYNFVSYSGFHIAVSVQPRRGNPEQNNM